jgi:hypothetical protein
LDGINIFDLIEENSAVRPQPIAFKSYKQQSYIDNQYKIYSADDGLHFELFDLFNDPYETSDIAATHPETVERLKKGLERWLASCEQSKMGMDY